MAKGTYIGVNNVARKVKKMYVGVGGVARKVKKGYIGVSGVARLFFSSGAIEYYTTLTGTTYGNGGAATNNSFLTFNSSGTNNHSTYFDASLTITQGNYDAVVERYGVGFDECTIYSPGRQYSSGSYTAKNNIKVIDSNKTASTVSISDLGTMDMSGARTNNYVIFGGGRSYTTKYTYYSGVMAISKSLTINVATSFSSKRCVHGVSLNNRVLFGGGNGEISGNSLQSVTYDDSLTQSIVTSASKYRYWCSYARAGNYALFGGGTSDSGDPYTDVDVYNSSFTRQNNISLSYGHYTQKENCAVTLDNHALFVGGLGAANVNDFDDSLVLTIQRNLSSASDSNVGAIGNYAVVINTKDVYQST